MIVSSCILGSAYLCGTSLHYYNINPNKLNGILFVSSFTLFFYSAKCVLKNA
jgi:hypothetical protein